MTTYTVAYWQTNQSTLDAGPSFTITDTAADISGAFDSLDLDTHITQLIISDNAAVTVTANQLFVSDGHAISLLKNANNSAYTLVVSDTGANITTYLNNLQANTHVTTIVVASGVVDATVAQLASDSTALANLKTSVGGSQASITVSDTSAHLHSGWANVAADSQASSIVISDNTQLTLTATQASQTSAVEKLVYNNSTTSNIVLVKDTAAHIEADIGQLDTVASFVASVTVSDSTFETLSASQVASYLAILEKIVFQSGPASFSVSDSSGQVSANLDALQALSGSISSIAVTDNSPITVSIAQLSNDSDALSLITYHSNPISVAVADTGSNISGNLATLEAAIQAESPPISSISVTSGVINTTVTQLNTDSAVFAALTGSYTLNVSDTASNISGALDTLQTFAHNGDISAINVTDSGNIAVTVAQITSDATAISELVDNDTNPYTLAVTDSAANIQAAFTSLGSNSHIASITFTGPSPVLTITASQFINGVTVLGEITNASFTIDVTGASAAQAATIATDFAGLPNKADATLSIAVSDMAANISSHLVALGANTYVATIAIDDSNPLSLTEGQYTGAGHDAGLAKMTGTYTVDVTGVTVAQVTTVEGITGLGGTPTLSIAVSDTASNVGGALSTLGSDSKVTSIAVSDSNPITLTEAQFTLPGDDAGLAKMTGSYTVDVTGATVAQVSTVEAVTLGGTPTLSIAVSDAGGSFTNTALQSLGADNDVTSIAVTSGIVSLNVTPFTNAADDAGFAKFVGTYTVQVLGASVAQVATVEGVSLPGTPTLQIWVSDSGTNLTDLALQTLGADSKVTLILVSDSNPITLTEAQFTGTPEGTGLAKLSGFYTVDVTGATVAQVSTVEAVPLPGSSTLSIAVSDTASNIAGALSTLGSDTHVTSIAVNDSNPIMLAEAAFVADSAGLAKMTGAYTVDVTGVSVAQVGTVEGVALGGTPTLSIAVSDTASAIENAVPTLGADSKVTSIAVSSGTITVTGLGFSIAGIDAGLAKFTGSYSIFASDVAISQLSMVESVTLGGTPTLTILIVDTGANFTSAALVNLGSDSKVVGIIVPSGPITLTEAQYTNSGDQAGLAKMDGTYTVDVTGVTVAQVATVEGQSPGGTPTLSIAVSDTGADLTAAKLITLGADSKVTLIAVTSGFLTLTQGQYASTSNEYPALQKMTGAYTVDVTNVGVAFVSTVEGLAVGGTPTLSIAVVDIGSRITSAKLVSLGADSKVTSIAISSGAVTLTEAQFVATADHAGLAKFIGSYTIAVTGVSVAQISTVVNTSLPGTPTFSIAVSDTGGNLSGTALATVGSYGNTLASITVTSGTITLNYGQEVSDSAALNKLIGTYAIQVTGVTVANVSNAEGVGMGGTPTLTITVSDSGTNLTDSALQSLGTDSHVVSIASTGGVISLVESQFVGTAEQAALAKMTGSYGINVALVTVAELSTVEGKTLGGTPSLSIDVNDTGANFTASALSTLGADSKVQIVSVSSGTITLTKSQITNSGTDVGLTKLNGSYTIAVTGVSVSQVATVEAVTLGGTPTLQIAVGDTAANLSGTEFATLGDDTNVTSIAVSSGTLTLTEAQFAADSAGLAKLTGTYAIQVTGATVAQVSTVEGTSLPGTPTLTITVSDTAASIASALGTLGSDSHVTSITINNSNPLILAEAAFVSDASGLAKMSGTYTVDVSATVAQVTTIEGISLGGTPTLSIAVADTAANVGNAETTLNADTHVTSVTVSDNAANISNYIDQLNGVTNLTHVTVTGGGILSLTYAQFTSDSHVFTVTTEPGYSHFFYNVVGATMAQASNVLFNHSSYIGSEGYFENVFVVDNAANVANGNVSVINGAAAIQINDTAADVSTSLNGLESIYSYVRGTFAITLSDPTDNLVVTEAQLSSDAPVLAAITNNPFNVAVTNVLAADVPNIPADVTSANSHATLSSISVTDNAANYAANQTAIDFNDSDVSLITSEYIVDTTAGLEANFVILFNLRHVAGITFTDPGTPVLTIAVDYLTADLGKVTNASWDLALTGMSAELAAQGGAWDSNYFLGEAGSPAGATLTSISVTDSAGDISYWNTNYGDLLNQNTLITQVNVVDSAGNVAAYLGNLNGVDHLAISLTDPGDELSVTESAFVANLTALGTVTNGAWNLQVTGLTVAQLATVEADEAALPNASHITFTETVSDIAANITDAALQSLGGDSKVTSITVSDSNPIALTESQFTGTPENAGLAKMAGSYTVDVSGVTVALVATVEAVTGLGGTPTLSIAVTDSAANITDSALQTLGADSKVTSIASTGGTIQLTETQFTSGPELAGLAKMTGSYAITVGLVTAAEVSTVESETLGGTPTLTINVQDIGSNLTSAALATLGADSKIQHISVSSGAITLTESQFTNSGTDAGLAKMNGSYAVDVTGVLASQVAAVEAVTLPGSPSLVISVSDGGTALTAAELTTLGADTKITSITTSSPISLTETQFTNSGVDAGLAKMIGTYTVNVTGVTVAQVATVEGQTGLGGTPTLSIGVSDTGANVTAGKLITLGADSKVTSIAITSGVLTLTQGQYASTSNEYPGLQKMVGAYTVDVTNVGVAFVTTEENLAVGGTPTVSLAVADIGARFTGAELTALGADSHVASITVTSGAISLTEAQFVASGEHAGLHKILGPYTVGVTGVTVAKVATVEAVTGLGGTPTLAIAVSDTAADFTSSALATLGADPKVTSIAVTSGVITLTEAQFTGSDSAAFAKMTGDFTVDVTGVTAAQVATVEGVGLSGTPTLSIAVSDTGGDLTSSVLTTLGADSRVTSIAVTSGPVLLTGTQFLTSGVDAGLAKIGGSYTVDVSNVTVAQLAAVESHSGFSGTPTLSIAISDTGGDLTNSALTTLGADSRVASIAVSSGAINLTESQFTTSGVDAGLSKMSGAYTIDVSGVTAAQVVTVEGIALGGTPTLSIAVSDSGANLTSVVLVSLGANAKVTLVAVTSGPIVLTEAQFTNSNDIAGLVKVTGNYTVDVTGVTVAQVSTVEAVNLAPSTPSLSIAISDTGADLSGIVLQNYYDDSNIGSITVTSGAISFTEAQFTNSLNAAAFSKLAGTYTVDVSSVTVAQVSTVEAVSLSGTPTLSIAVADTGAHLTSAALLTLGGDADVTSIALTSGVIALGEAQYTSAGDDAGLAKVVGTYTIDVRNVAVAQVAAVEAITGLGGTPTLSIAVTDSGSNITGAALATLGADGKVTSITDTGGAISLTEAQYTGAATDAGLAKMIGTYTVDVSSTVAQVSAIEAITGLGGTPTLSIAVSDVGANFTNTALTNLGSDPDVTSITVSSGAISLTESQYTYSLVDAGLDKVTGNFTVDVSGVQISQVSTVEGLTLASTPTLSIAVSDIGSNFTDSALQSLGTDNDVTSIAVSSGAIVLNGVQFTGPHEGMAFAKMTGTYTVDVTGISVAQIPTIEGVSLAGTPTLSIGVYDIGGNLTGAVLSTLGSDTKVTSISDAGGVLSLTEAQFTSSSVDAGLAKMTGSYTVDVSGVTAAQVSVVEGQTGLGGTPSLSLAVSDVGANFNSVNLTNFGSDSDIASITVTSGAISLTESQFANTNVDAGLDKVTGNFTVDVSGVLVSQIGTVEGVSLSSTPTLSIAVFDTGSHVTSDFYNLGGDANITSIAVTSGALSLDVSVYAVGNDLAALAKMTGSYTIDLTGVSVAQIELAEGATYGGTPTLSIAVSDSGLNLTDAVLQSLGVDSNVTSISVNDSNPISLTEAQFTGAPELAGLAKMTGSYTVDVSGVAVAQVSVVEGQTGLGGTPTLSLAVSDVGANFTSSALTSLGSDGDIASIVVTSGVIVLSEAHFFAEGVDAGLEKVAGNYTVDVTGVTVADVSTVEAVSLIPSTPNVSIAVSDTGADITDSALQTLGADNQVASISVLSGAIVLTAAQFLGTPELAGLGKMTGHYTVDVSGATVAQVVSIDTASIGGNPALSIAVSDSGANLTSGALTGLGAGSNVVSVTDTGGAITLTEAQFTNANVEAGLAKMIGSYTVDVTNVHVAQVSTVEGLAGLGGTPTLSIAVSDTGANITDGALQTLGADGDISSIAVTSGVVALTEAQFVGSAEDAGLEKIVGNYTIDVSGVSVAQVSTVEGLSLVPSTPALLIAVSDTGSNFTDSALQSLGTDNDITSIAVTSGAILLGEAAVYRDGRRRAFGKMTGSYIGRCVGVTVAEIGAVEAVSSQVRRRLSSR